MDLILQDSVLVRFRGVEWRVGCRPRAIRKQMAYLRLEVMVWSFIHSFTHSLIK